MDVNLPTQSGWEILETLQKSDKYRSIATVMFSTAETLYYEAQQKLDITQYVIS